MQGNSGKENEIIYNNIYECIGIKTLSKRKFHLNFLQNGVCTLNTL